MDQEQFTKKLSLNPRPVVVDVWAAWCMPCRAIEPVVKRLEQEYTGRVDVWKVTRDENASLVQYLGVRKRSSDLLSSSQRTRSSRSIGARSPAALADLFTVALGEEVPPNRGLAATDRALRLIAGTILLAIGIFTGASWLLLGVAGLVLFSAVYDRCPIWQAIASSPETPIWRPGSIQGTNLILIGLSLSTVGWGV